MFMQRHRKQLSLSHEVAYITCINKIDRRRTTSNQQGVQMFGETLTVDPEVETSGRSDG